MTKQVHGKSGANTGNAGGGQSKAGKLKEKKSQSNSTKSNQTAAATAVAAATAAASSATAAANAQKQAVDSKLLTPEQRRLASLMNDKIDVNEIEKKVNKIIELTGASKDKAIVALHDCANELDKAIDMILEGDSLNEGEWKSQVRKKKPKVVGGTSTAGNKENSADFGGSRHYHQNGEGRGGRGKREGPPRGERPLRGKGDGAGGRRNAPRDNFSNFTKESNIVAAPVESFLPSNNDDDWETSVQDDNWGDQPVVAAVPEFVSAPPASSTSDTFTSKPRFSGGSSVQSKGGFRSGGSGERPQNRGSYAGKAGSAPNRSGPPRTYQNKNYQDGSNFPNSIDTWSNNEPTAPASNPTNEFDNKIGNWSDMAEGEAVSEEDWDAAPMETKVFTSSRTNEPPKPKMPNLAEIVSGVKPKPPTAAAIVKGLASTTADSNKLSAVSTETVAPIADSSQVESSASLTEQFTSDNLTATSLVPPSQPSSAAVQQIQQSIDHSASVAPTNSSLPISNSAQTPQVNKIDLATLLKPSLPSQPTQQSAHPTTQLQTSAQPQHSQASNVAAASVANTVHQPSLNQLISSGQLPGARQSNAAAGVALLQQLTQQTSAPSGYRPLHYSKQASDNIKNLVGIPTNTAQSNQYTAANGQQFADQNAIRQQQRSGSSNRIPSRRTTKIPESAVEMPNADHISSLNVQFGALDFGADSYLTNESGANTASGTSFSDLQPPKPPTQPKLPPGQAASQPTHAQPSSVAQTNLNQMLTQVQSDANAYSKASAQELNQMASQLVSSQQLADSVLERAKQNVPSNTGPSSHHYGQKPGLYSQQGGDSGSSQMSYKYGGESAANSHYGSGYGQSQSSYGYSSGNTQPAGYGVNAGNSSGYGSYGSSSMSASSNPSNGSSHQKLSLKDMENTSANSSNLSSQSLGLVSSSTVTTNVLKNTLTATGKAGSLAPNVAPGVNPLLGTPQYVISQPGLSAFYPIYDMPLAGREHNFGPYAPQPSGPSTAPEAKYGSRTDPSDTNTGVQSSQAPVTQPAGHLFGQFPPHYGFFYTGVNMMPQSLYQTAGPFLQMQPPNPAAAAASGAPSAHSQGSVAAAAAAAAAAGGFSKPQSQAYGSHSAFSNYGLSAQMQAHNQDYGKSYGGQSGGSVDSQQGSQSASSGGPSGGSKQNTGSGGNDLSNSNMYTKSHAQLTKNYDKPNFQTGTPPPFNMANAQMNASALGSYQNQYIPMLQPQSNPSMLHHSLQSDGSGAGNQRSMGQSQKNSSSNKYYNWN